MINVTITFDGCDPFTIKCKAGEHLLAIMQEVEASYIKEVDASHGYVICNGIITNYTFRIEGIRGRRPKNS